MYEIVSHRWEKGRVIITRKRPLFETEKEAIMALNKIRKNRNSTYHIREVENGN